MQIVRTVESLLLILAAISNDVDCETTYPPSTTTVSSSTPASASTTRRYRRPTRRPFNQETAVRRHVIKNAKMQSSNVPPTPIFSNVTHIELNLFVNGVSRIDDVPHQMHLYGLVCMKWHNIALVWGEAAYKNVAHIPAYFWEIWTPRLIYYYRKSAYNPFGKRKKWVDVNSNGICTWCYPVPLVLNCEELDARNNECKAHLRLLGYPDTDIKFNISEAVTLMHRLDLPDLKIDNIRLINSFNKSTAPSMVSDEITLIMKTVEGHPLDFVTLTLPVVCIVIATMLAGGVHSIGSSKEDSGYSGSESCKRTQQRIPFTSRCFNMFSLRVWIGVFTGVVCCLSLSDHRLHPRLANAPYLSWLLGLLATVSVISFGEELYETTRPHISNATEADDSKIFYWNVLRIAFCVVAVGIVLLI